MNPSKPQPEARTLIRVSRRALTLALCSAAMISTLGCQDDNEIRSYHTPTEQPGRVAPMTSSPAVASAQGGEVLHWTLPAGWTETPGDGDMRFATLSDERSTPPLTVTVTKLPARAGELLANVNRWRGQLALPPIEEADLGQSVQPLESGQIPGIVVNLESAPSDAEGAIPIRMVTAIFETSDSTWFFKAAGPASVISAGEADLMSLLSSVHSSTSHAAESTPAPTPPSGAPIIVSEPAAQPLEYTIPEGWREDPATRPARLATLLIGGDPAAAEMAITRFPGDVGGDLANVNRWRGQIGLPPVPTIEEAAGTDRMVSGQPGTVFRIAAPGGGDQQPSILVALVKHDGHIWFFKIVGPIGVLDAQREQFDAFLTSIQLQGG